MLDLSLLLWPLVAMPGHGSLLIMRMQQTPPQSGLPSAMSSSSVLPEAHACLSLLKAASSRPQQLCALHARLTLIYAGRHQ